MRRKRKERTKKNMNKYMCIYIYINDEKVLGQIEMRKKRDKMLSIDTC